MSISRLATRAFAAKFGECTRKLAPKILLSIVSCDLQRARFLTEARAKASLLPTGAPMRTRIVQSEVLRGSSCWFDSRT